MSHGIDTGLDDTAWRRYRQTSGGGADWSPSLPLSSGTMARPATPLARTGAVSSRRYRPAVSAAAARSNAHAPIQAVRSADPLLSPAQHSVLYRTRRGIQVALAAADVFARQTNLEHCRRVTPPGRLPARIAAHFKALLSLRPISPPSRLPPISARRCRKRASRWTMPRSRISFSTRRRMR